MGHQGLGRVGKHELAQSLIWLMPALSDLGLGVGAGYLLTPWLG